MQHTCAAHRSTGELTYCYAIPSTDQRSMIRVGVVGKSPPLYISSAYNDICVFLGKVKKDQHYILDHKGV